MDEEKKEPKRKRGILHYLWQIRHLLKEYRWQIITICLGSIVFGVVRLVDPNIYRVIFDDVLVGALTGKVGHEEAWKITIRLCIYIFLIRVVSSLIFSWYTYLSMEVSQLLEMRMFRQALVHLQALDMSFHHTRNSGEVLSRVERGIDATIAVLHGQLAKTFLPSLVNVACLSVIIFLQDWRMAIAATCFIPFHLYISLRKSKPIFERQREVNRSYEKLSHRAYEGIWNVEAVRAFNGAPQELAMFDAERGKALEHQMQIARWWRIIGFSASFFEIAGRLAVIFLGVYLVLKGETTPGAIVMFLAYTSMLYQPLLDLITTYLDMQAGLSKIERFFDLLEVKAKVDDINGAIEMPPLRHSIELKNVSFGYGEEKHALRDVNLTIPVGKKVAFVGPSGAGKSTIANILLRFYDPTHGIVTFDGMDSRKLKLDSLHEQITIVPQHALLFSRTIKDNIAYGTPRASDEQIIAAAKVAAADEFIMEKEGGYDTMIGEKGVKLSGGQQQRISIARAVLRDASVIILDEATSHLDSKSEQLVQEALWEKLTQGKTAIMIAHRLSTVMKADMIVVVDGGRIVDTGTHYELLQRCELYQNLCALQFGEQ